MLNYPNILETDRLIFRKLDLADVDAWNRFLSDDQSVNYLAPDVLRDPDPAVKWICRQQNRYNSGHLGLLGIDLRETGKLIGQSGLIYQNLRGDIEVELGYHLLAPYRGNGYAREAAQFFRDWAFQHLQIPSLISIIHPKNAASIRVAKNIGMQLDGEIRFKKIRVHVFRIPREEWRYLGHDKETTT